MSAHTFAASRARRGMTFLGRSTSKTVLAAGGVNAFTSLAGSLGGIVLARGLGPSARGDLVAVLQWPTVLAVLGSLGITTATCYLISNDRTHAAAITATGVWCAIAVGLLLAVFGALILAPVIARTNEVRFGLVIAFLAAPIFIAGGIFVSALQAVDMQGWNISRVVQPIGYLVLVVLLWSVGRLSLMAAVCAYACSLVAQIVVGGTLTYRRLGSLNDPHWEHARHLYSYGPKVTISTLPQIVNVQVDLLVLSVLPAVTAARLGNYAVAVSLATLALPIAVAAGSVAFPLVAGTKSEATRRRVERKAIVFAAVAAGSAAIALSLAAPFVVRLLFGTGFESAVPCLWLLAPGIVCLAIVRVLGDILRGRGRPLLVSVAQGAGAVATILGLTILVPLFGILGAAATSSVAYGVVLVVLLRCLHIVREPSSSL